MNFPFFPNISSNKSGTLLDILIRALALKPEPRKILKALLCNAFRIFLGSVAKQR